MLKSVEVAMEGGSRIPAEVIYSGRRTMALEVKDDGRVCVRVPYGTPDPAVYALLSQRRDWLIQAWQEAHSEQAFRQTLPVKDYVKDPALVPLYRQKALARIKERIRYYAPRLGVSYNRITVKDMKTRWGSASGKGNLNFHWKLILMPSEVLDYVVVHELAHLRRMDHSPEFWRIVGSVFPDYRRWREWLKVYGRYA